MSLEYYDENAEEYQSSTDCLDMSDFYQPLLEQLEGSGRILDAGCGPGRDALYFLQSGYVVDAFDASGSMVRLAKIKTGLPVKQIRFQDFSSSGIYDGIWASASLLHVPPEEINGVFARLAASLKPGGIFYGSFKLGRGTTRSGERMFTNMDEDSLEQVIDATQGLKLLRAWVTNDRRPRLSKQNWINFLAKNQVQKK